MEFTYNSVIINFVLAIARIKTRMKSVYQCLNISLNFNRLHISNGVYCLCLLSKGQRIIGTI